MPDAANAFCPKPDCKDHGLRNMGNIGTRGKYGKDKAKTLLHCRTCGLRFSETQSTAFFGLHLPDDTIRQIVHHAAEGVSVRGTARLVGCDKDTVNRVILRAGEHCAVVLSNLLISLRLTEAQLDELWTFVKKRNVLTLRKRIANQGRSNTVRHDLCITACTCGM